MCRSQRIEWLVNEFPFYKKGPSSLHCSARRIMVLTGEFLAYEVIRNQKLNELLQFIFVSENEAVQQSDHPRASIDVLGNIDPCSVIVVVLPEQPYETFAVLEGRYRSVMSTGRWPRELPEITNTTHRPDHDRRVESESRTIVFPRKPFWMLDCGQAVFPTDSRSKISELKRWFDDNNHRLWQEGHYLLSPHRMRT